MGQAQRKGSKGTGISCAGQAIGGLDLRAQVRVHSDVVWVRPTPDKTEACESLLV